LDEPLLNDLHAGSTYIADEVAYNTDYEEDERQTLRLSNKLRSVILGTVPYVGE